MRCERLLKYASMIVFVAACSKEREVTPVTTTTASPPTITNVSTAAPQPAPASYDDAVRWFRSTPGFHFVVEESGVRAEGDMTRERLGSEEVKVAVSGESWTARAGAKGVTWKRGGRDVAAPDWGNRLFQRVTIALDPQKSEGEPLTVEPRHFRFTDANSGAVHEVRVNEAGQIETMTIGTSFSMTLSAHR